MFLDDALTTARIPLDRCRNETNTNCYNVNICNVIIWAWKAEGQALGATQGRFHTASISLVLKLGGGFTGVHMYL